MVRTRRNGAVDSVYTIYSFYPLDENAGKRPSERIDISWATDIPGVGYQSQKIANTMRELVYGRMSEPTVIADSLVRAVLGWDNTIRQVKLLLIMNEARS